VIFCLAIEMGSEADLEMLQTFITSLEVACPVSSSVSKLHQLCTVLYNVAVLYIEAAKNQQPVGTEFDMYLSQLGFMPGFNDNNNNNGGAAGVGSGAEHMEGVSLMPQSNQLGDWFEGNNYMLGLLEEDLSSINPTALQLGAF
jgi:hypothetical protein